MASQQSLVKEMWRHPDHVTGAHGSFYGHSLEVRPLHLHVVACDFQVFLLFPPYEGKYVRLHWLAV